MATYYANLDVLGTGGNGLSEGTAWGYDEFQTKVFAQLDNDSIVKTKGKHDYGSSTPIYIYSNNSGPITLENWGPNPWKIKCSNFLAYSTSTVTNGIVEAYGDGIVSAGARIYNCFIKAAVAFTNNNSSLITPMDVKGCTIIAPQIWGSTYSCTGEIGSFKDSILSGVIDISVPGSFDAINTDNCVFTDAVIPGIGVHNNAQTGWTPPAWPLWDAEQSAFSSDLLSVGILSDPPSGSAGKPNPGNPPYIGYEVGLWDSIRTGIGAMDFPEAPTTTTTEAPRRPRDIVTSDNGPGSRTVHGNTVADYHAPWWLQ